MEEVECLGLCQPLRFANTGRKFSPRNNRLDRYERIVASLLGFEQDLTNTSIQTKALKDAKCKRILEDTISGTRRDRPELKRALDLLREGDTLVVWKLDRLGRSVKDLVELVAELEKRGVHFRSLTDAIDTSTPAGHFFFHVMASLAQMERELLVERTQAGLEAAKAAGRVGGRKLKMTPSKVQAARQLLDAGVPPKDVALNLGISVPTLYRWLPAGEKKSAEKK